MNPPGILAKSSRIVVTCAKRLSPFLQKEIEGLGFKIERAFPTGVALHGTFNDTIRLNLSLRCASQVLFSLKEFPADHPDRVYATLVALPWEELLPKDGYFSVTSAVNHPTVNNNLFMNVKVKDAIADRLRKVTGSRPDSGPELTGAVIHLFWQERTADIFLDTSGETLAKHGYRKNPGAAPMMETLAAATLLAAKWDQKSPFVNPMCGAGTIAIEAALLATERRPGLLRKNYAFQHVNGYDAKIYEREAAKLKERVREVPGLRIIATDINPEAVRIAKGNAEAAGVASMIEFGVCDFAETPIPEKTGVVYLNPEYGERLGELQELEGVYARIGDFLKKKCQGTMGYVFTGNMDLAKKIGLKASRRIEFYAAKIDSRLLEYEMYAGTKREF